MMARFCPALMTAKLTFRSEQSDLHKIDQIMQVVIFDHPNDLGLTRSRIRSRDDKTTRSSCS